MGQRHRGSCLQFKVELELLSLKTQDPAKPSWSARRSAWGPSPAPGLLCQQPAADCLGVIQTQAQGSSACHWLDDKRVNGSTHSRLTLAAKIALLMHKGKQASVCCVLQGTASVRHCALQPAKISYTEQQAKVPASPGTRRTGTCSRL